MARTVREIMNPEVFTLPETAKTADALGALLELDITAAPVIDDEGRPAGVTSLRDLVAGKEPIVSTPAFAVAPSLPVEEAARLMAEHGTHHLVVVGTDGRVAGFISSYDLVRALVGLPPKFPPTFPHRDRALDVTWTDVTPFDADHLSAVPEGAGVIVLSAGGVRCTETDLWAEATALLRARMTDLLELPQGEHALARILAQKGLRFRCARVEDIAQRQHVAQTLRERIERAPYPHDVIPAEG